MVVVCMVRWPREVTSPEGSSPGTGGSVATDVYITTEVGFSQEHVVGFSRKHMAGFPQEHMFLVFFYFYRKHMAEAHGNPKWREITL